MAQTDEITGSAILETGEGKRLTIDVFATGRAIVLIGSTEYDLQAQVHVTEQEAADFAIAILGAVAEARRIRALPAAGVPA